MMIFYFKLFDCPFRIYLVSHSIAAIFIYNLKILHLIRHIFFTPANILNPKVLL